MVLRNTQKISFPDPGKDLFKNAVGKRRKLRGKLLGVHARIDLQFFLKINVA